LNLDDVPTKTFLLKNHTGVEVVPLEAMKFSRFQHGLEGS